MSGQPDRTAVERTLGQQLLDWQWTTLLGVLGHLPTKEAKPASTDEHPWVNDSAVRHTCEVCGREGSRRFVKTDIGWRCSPTATACSGHRKPTEAPAPRTPSSGGNTTDLIDPAPEPPVARPADLPPSVTAKCQDCTRTWNLTGRVLQTAVQMHELKASHIVMVFDKAAVSAG